MILPFSKKLPRLADRGKVFFFIKNPHSDIANNYTHTQIEALISLFKDIREGAHIAI